MSFLGPILDIYSPPEKHKKAKSGLKPAFRLGFAWILGESVCTQVSATPLSLSKTCITSPLKAIMTVSP